MKPAASMAKVAVNVVTTAALLWLGPALSATEGSGPQSAGVTAPVAELDVLKEGIRALEAQRYQDAASAFEAAAHSQATPQVYLGWSAALEGLKRPSEALAKARQAQQLAPRDTAVLRRVAQLQIHLDAPTEALDTLASWRRAEPSDSAPILLSALVLRRIERLDEALALLEAALSDGLGEAPIFAQAAFLQLTLGRPEAARRTADQGLQLFPEDGELTLARGLADAAEPETRADAAPLLRRALQLGVPDEAKARLELGALLLDAAANGCDRDGIAELETARRLRPDLAQIHFRLGNALRACGDSEAGTAALREFQRLNRRAESTDHGGRQVGTRLNQAQTAAQEGRLRAALQEVDGALEEAPDDPRAWTLKGKILFSLERPKEAVDAVRRARDLSPGRVEAHYLEGFFLSRSGRLTEAQAALEKALALDGGQAQAQSLLAAVTADLGDFEAAAEHFKKAVRLTAEDAALRLAYAKVLAELGRQDESRRQMELYRVLSGQ